MLRCMARSTPCSRSRLGTILFGSAERLRGDRGPLGGISPTVSPRPPRWRGPFLVFSRRSTLFTSYPS
jgi:hypothetical protein